MRHILTGMIRVYQACLSPLLGPCCRFEPSCSEYCATAISKYGCIKGVWMGFLRIARCHPFHAGGFDPVPGTDSADKGCLRNEQD